LLSRRLLALPLVACAVLVLSTSAASASTHKPTFHPRVRGALGLIPPVNRQGLSAFDLASSPLTPATYHGGSVMGAGGAGITIHTIFWSGGTNPFQGQPAGAPATYEGMLEQFFTDVAHDSGTSTNVFSVLPQFGQGTTLANKQSGDYGISYSASNPDDAIIDTHPYPTVPNQCASPNNASVCVTDTQVQAEVDRVVQSTSGTPRGLNNLWFVFLPPGVDECIAPGVCGTNAFGGYHSVSDVGHGATIYAVAIDPIIETGGIPSGIDPEGYPDAEVTIDIAAHETVEATTDPEGVGWMDPNGFEVGDKCEFGPQRGTPIGFATNGAPYNQVINGHLYLLQEMWANADGSGNPNCVQSTTATDATNGLPLPQVSLTQFSSTVSGNIEHPTAGVGVSVALMRADANGNPVTVAHGSATTASDGSWSVSLGHHAVGDDRDEIDVTYSGPGAPTPGQQTILTGNGGNPFTESGWTGWTALDQGTAVTPTSVTVAPCFQTGVLTISRNGTPLSGPNGESPIDFCSTQNDSATMPVSGSPLGVGDVVREGSLDNRAFMAPGLPNANPLGGLVSLTVPAGEPNSVSLVTPELPPFTPTGFPACSADLEMQTVSCSGLVSGESYRVTDGSHHASQAADATGTVSVSLPVKGGNSVVLSNAVRTLTTLHVANLKVNITGEQPTVSGGTCQADEYYAPPLGTPPTSAAAGAPTAAVGGAALTDQICPGSGHAGGLSAVNIAQTDELSQGETTTEVPHLVSTTPTDGEVLYGGFTALARTGFLDQTNSVVPTDSTTKVALTIRTAPGGRKVFAAANVDTRKGVQVPALARGHYTAIWVITDANRDTRTLKTRLVEQTGAAPKGHSVSVSCRRGAHKKIACKVTFANKHVSGKLRVRVSRGGKVLATGSGTVSHGKATVSLKENGHVKAGQSTVTLVLTVKGKHSTFVISVRLS
jgi:hypothetical protein